MSRRGTWLTLRVRAWLERAEAALTAKRCGGDQLCPWCKSWMNQFTATYVRDFPVDDLEEITCGNCFGTSVWRWEMGFFFVCAGEPPTGANSRPTYGDGAFVQDRVRAVRRVLVRRHSNRKRVRDDCGWALSPAKPRKEIA